LRGEIVRIEESFVYVRRTSTKRLIKVELPDPPEIYSAFGGDISVEELAPGQWASVWFVICKWPKTGTPVAAYFQVYSKNPTDGPK